MAVDYLIFLRRVGVPFVRRYLDAVGISPAGIDDDSDEAELLAILEREASGDHRVWSVFEQAEQFSPRPARAALRSVLVQQRGLLATFDAMTESNRECALWLAATNPSMFEQAVSALNTLKLVGGRSWDGFRIVGSSHAITPEMSETAIADFERGARSALNASKTAVANGKVKAVPFQRLLIAESAHSQRAVSQITVFSEGPRESRDKISETHEIHSEVIRRVDAGAVIFDQKLRTIEVAVLGGARVRRAMADAFCRAFLPRGIQVVRLVNRDIDFSKFSGEPFLPLEADDPVEHVAVDEIRFLLPNSGGGLITLERPYSAADRSSIYVEARTWPDVPSLERMVGWQVVAVRLRFLFKGAGLRRKPRVRTLELKTPNRTNLREKSDSDHSVMYELLERWRIFKEEPYAEGAED